MYSLYSKLMAQNKRKAEFQLDRDRYGQAVKDNMGCEPELADENDRIASAEEIGQRKIYKAKRLTRPGDALGNRPSVKGKFKLLGSLEASKPIAKTEPPKLITRPVENSKPQATESEPKAQTLFGNVKPQESKVVESNFSAPKKELPKPSENSGAKTLFGRKIGDTSTPSVFANKPDPSATKNLVGVFGSSAKPSPDIQQKSIFLNKPVTPTENKVGSIPGITAPAEKKSIFGSSNTKPSIFSKPKEAEQPKIEKTPEPKPTKNKPVETKPLESKPVEIKPLQTKPAEVKPTETKPSLFGNKGSNIFGKASSEPKKEEPKKEEPKKTSLFGSNTTSQSGSLFGKPKSAETKDVKEDEKPKYASLFGNNKPAAPAQTEPKKGLFGVNTSGGLFSGSNKLFGGPSLFAGMNKDSKPEDQKNSFISSHNQKDEEEKEDEEKAKEEDKKPKFVAVSKDPYTKIFTRQVERFKTSKNDKGNGIISIETGETDGKKFVLFNFRNPIGKTLFTGQIMPNCKKAQALDKPGKIQSRVMLIEKDMKTATLKPMPTLLTFNRTDDLNEFEKKWDEAKAFLAS